MVSIRLSFIFLFIINITLSQEVNWISMDKAQELQKKVPKNIMMDVYTDWCGPCKAMAPIINDLKSEMGDHARILKIDVDRIRIDFAASIIDFGFVKINFG